jgi:hypothetical protein
MSIEIAGENSGSSSRGRRTEDRHEPLSLSAPHGLPVALVQFRCNLIPLCPRQIKVLQSAPLPIPQPRVSIVTGLISNTVPS